MKKKYQYFSSNIKNIVFSIINIGFSVIFILAIYFFNELNILFNHSPVFFMLTFMLPFLIIITIQCYYLLHNVVFLSKFHKNFKLEIFKDKGYIRYYNISEAEKIDIKINIEDVYLIMRHSSTDILPLYFDEICFDENKTFKKIIIPCTIVRNLEYKLKKKGKIKVSIYNTLLISKQWKNQLIE